jgi:hypothetical protein
MTLPCKAYWRYQVKGTAPSREFHYQILAPVGMAYLPLESFLEKLNTRRQLVIDTTREGFFFMIPQRDIQVNHKSWSASPVWMWYVARDDIADPFIMSIQDPTHFAMAVFRDAINRPEGLR